MKTKKQKSRLAKEKGANYRVRPASVKKLIRLSPSRAELLSSLAASGALGEDEIVEKALDILFNQTGLLDQRSEDLGWSFASNKSLERLWDNDEDAMYDDWRKLYGVPAR